jgi:hypothetical protein
MGLATNIIKFMPFSGMWPYLGTHFDDQASRPVVQEEPCLTAGPNYAVAANLESGWLLFFELVCSLVEWNESNGQQISLRYRRICISTYE